jgi:putative spermidine/putrescine transport system ATP-binding protein
MRDIMKEPILSLKNVIKHFGSVVAVNNVSLDIEEGWFMTLLGPSGSGKTTLLNMIAGFELPTGGEVILQRKLINHLLPEKRNIGMVFQTYALFPHMSIFENIAFPLKMRKLPKAEIVEQVKKALELVELEGYGDRKPNELSGGQQQRIAMARALVFDPPILLLDEPLGALDKKLRQHMQIELKHIHTKLKRTMIYVTHDQEEALVMSDRIAVMNQGRIEQIGSPDELYEKPANAFVAGFIGESNFLQGRVVKRDGDRLTLRMSDGTEHALVWEMEAGLQEEVNFCIRPEKMFFVDDRCAEFFLNGTIEEVVYVGETERYKVRISKEKKIDVRKMSVVPGGGPRVGESVKIAWHKDSLRRV